MIRPLRPWRTSPSLFGGLLVFGLAVSTVRAQETAGPKPAGADKLPAPRAGAEAGKRTGLLGPVPSSIDPKAIRKLSVDVLKTLLRNNRKLQDTALKMAESCKSQAAMESAPEIVIEKLPPQLRPPNADRVREWAGELLEGKPLTLKRYHDFMATYWLDVANRYGQNAIVIYDAIVDK